MSELPEGMANGHCRSENGRIWERPWTLEEMRQNGANWSLAADSGLFLFLQDFSQRMLSKTHEIEKQLDSLIRDTKATDSCLHSVFNDFLMLSNTQFIENRVYDEEVEETLPKTEVLEKQHEQEKTREQKEAELIPKMQEAVRYGLEVLESAFEHLDMKAGNSDSEDEEVMDRVEPILEPKDLYVDRPLPYLIGSQAFMEHEDVGLGDLSSDEMSVDSDRDSVIESEDGRETDHSDEDYDKEDDPIHIKKKSSSLSYDAEEDDEDSDIFGESDKDEDDDDLKATGPSSFADELAARIKGEAINKPEGDRASFTSKKKSKGRKESKAANTQGTEDDSDDMFKPPKMEDDEFSPFGGKGGLFSGGRGLFSDDEGDLFSEAPKSPKPEEKKAPQESMKHTSQATETNKAVKKIPAGAVSIFPENSLFGSGNDSDTEEGKDNGPPPLKTNATTKPVLLGAGSAGGGGGGLFDDDDDEDDDFFSGKNIKRSNTAEHEKPKAQKAIDLFDDDEDGDIFGNRALAPSQSTTEPAVEQPKPPEKKMPAGAISLFGPGTKSLLNEGLKKRQQSTTEEPGRSEEKSSTPDVGPGSSKQKPKAETRGLFSDDEDTQVFPTITKSQSNPESTSQSKTNKAPLSLFDDEEEEDLFAYAAKTKPTPSQAKVSTQEPSKATSSSLFSDDEDQWMSSKSSSMKTETKAGGMKSSASAPTSLLSSKTTAKGSLFDDNDNDLFASSNTSSQKKPQRVALLFEDENDEDNGSLFGTKPAVNTSAVGAAETQNVASVSKQTSLPKSKETLPESDNAQVRAPETSSTPPLAEISESKKKPAGAVSLFGGIDVFASKQTKSPLQEAEDDDLFLPKDSLSKGSKKEEKPKTTSVSLFDDGDDEDAELDSNAQIFAPRKTASQKTLKSTEERPQTKSTGVFQDEELLFSQTQQKDNDPDVDLFATSGKAASSKPNLVKPAAQSLFSDEDEDDLFGPAKQRVPPPKAPEKLSKPTDTAPLATPDPISENQKPASGPVKPKDSSSRIGKLQASLMINPAALLPGATASLPGAVTVGPSSSSGVSSSSLSPSPVISPTAAQADSEGGVSFDVPVQVSTLQIAQKSRAKGSAHRRPQSRAARQQAAQTLMEDQEKTTGGDSPAPNSSLSGLVPPNKANILSVSKPLANSAGPTALSTSSNSQPSQSKITPRPSDLTLPVSASAEKRDSKANSRKVPPSSDEDDLFASDGLFGATSVTKTATQEQTTTKTHRQASSVVGVKKENGKSTLSSIFDDDADDLFQKVKQRPSPKVAKVPNFLDEQDDNDIFGLSNSSTPTSAKETQNSSRFSKNDIFQDEVTTVPKVHEKHKEKTLNASLFSENIDIFADLSDTLKPKQSKSKTKGETKSIFDDDMDDIFSSSTVRAVATAPRKSKKSPPAQDTARTTEPSNIFDDPLNALGGN